jgi:protein-tyrosine phosphatase
MIRVLFVCTGNICRSPMAEAVFQHKVNAAGLAEQFEIDSAGTGSWHIGETAHKGTLALLKRNNIPYNGRARQISRADLSRFDYIVAMDTENLSGIRRLGEANGAEIGLFLKWAKAAGTVNTDEVPDPYYDDTFDYTYELVDKGASALLDHIRQEHGI